jgi:hypothetical protein
MVFSLLVREGFFSSKSNIPAKPLCFEPNPVHLLQNGLISATIF